MPPAVRSALRFSGGGAQRRGGPPRPHRVLRWSATTENIPYEDGWEEESSDDEAVGGVRRAATAVARTQGSRARTPAACSCHGRLCGGLGGGGGESSGGSGDDGSGAGGGPAALAAALVTRLPTASAAPASRVPSIAQLSMASVLSAAWPPAESSASLEAAASASAAKPEAAVQGGTKGETTATATLPRPGPAAAPAQAARVAAATPTATVAAGAVAASPTGGVPPPRMAVVPPPTSPPTAAANHPPVTPLSGRVHAWRVHAAAAAAASAASGGSSVSAATTRTGAPPAVAAASQPSRSSSSPVVPPLSGPTSPQTPSTGCVRIMCTGTAVGMAPAVASVAECSPTVPLPRRLGGRTPPSATHPPLADGVDAATVAPQPPLLSSGERAAKEELKAGATPVDALKERQVARAAAVGGHSEARAMKFGAGVGAASTVSAMVGVLKPSQPAAENKRSIPAGTPPELVPPSCWAGDVRSASGQVRRLGAGGPPVAGSKEADSHEGCWAGVLRNVGGGRLSAAAPWPPPPPESPPTLDGSLHPRHGRRHPRRRPAVHGAAGSRDGGGGRKGSPVEPAGSGGGENETDPSAYLGGGGGGGDTALASRRHVRESAGGGVAAMAVGGC